MAAIWDINTTKMKVIYSEIKKLVPGLKAKPREIGEALTMAGLMLDGFEEIKYQGKKDWLLSFEVRQNRADCFSVYGIAREVAAYYGLKLVLPKFAITKITKEKGKENLAVTIAAGTSDVRRVLAVKMSEVKNTESPVWLKVFLSIYGLNSKNLLVDLSNYVMIVTGYPSHLLDLDKVAGKISWIRARVGEKITTLDGTVVVLKKDDGVAIKDEEKILALAGIVGGKEAEISATTNNIFVEMAVYKGAVIRKNSRDTRIVTEASSRLEKDLDPEESAAAFHQLISLILKYAKGKIVSNTFEYYPVKPKKNIINFNAETVSVFSGIDIKPVISAKILKNLGFTVKQKSKNSYTVLVPSFRTDIALPEDLVEEVVRIHGYQRIPADETPVFKATKDITPCHIKLVQTMKSILHHNGFDEILSLPLCERNENAKANYQGWETILAENAVNELYPELRQSLVIGLVKQAQEFQKKNISWIDIFESGKIFGKKDGKFLEQESFGVLSFSEENTITDFKNNIEGMIRMLGYSDIRYGAPKIVPEMGNPDSCWEIIVAGKVCGIFYKLKREAFGNSIDSPEKKNAYFAELNVDALEKTKADATNPVVELIEKLVVLDMNVQAGKNEKIENVIEKIKNGIPKNNLWSLDVIDKFSGNDIVKHTIRITYTGLSDPDAKKINAAILNDLQSKKS